MSKPMDENKKDPQLPEDEEALDGISDSTTPSDFDETVESRVDYDIRKSLEAKSPETIGEIYLLTSLTYGKNFKKKAKPDEDKMDGSSTKGQETKRVIEEADSNEGKSQNKKGDEKRDEEKIKNKNSEEKKEDEKKREKTEKKEAGNKNPEDGKGVTDGTEENDQTDQSAANCTEASPLKLSEDSSDSRLEIVSLTTTEDSMNEVLNLLENIAIKERKMPDCNEDQEILGCIHSCLNMTLKEDKNDLEKQLGLVLEQNQELLNINANLQKQVKDLKDVTVFSDGATSGLMVSTDTLEPILKRMREVAVRKSELEHEKNDLEKQLLKAEHCSKPLEASADMQSMELLQSRLREVDKKLELQNVLHEELMIEMAAMKKSGPKPSMNLQWKPTTRLSNQEVQTSPDVYPSTSGYRSSNKAQRTTQNVPFCSITHTATSHYRPKATFTEPFLKSPQLTRHRSLTNVADFDYKGASSFTPYATWTDSRYKQDLEYLPRSLSQTNLRSNLPTSLDSQFRNINGQWNPLYCDVYTHGDRLRDLTDMDLGLGIRRKQGTRSYRLPERWLRSDFERSPSDPFPLDYNTASTMFPGADSWTTDHIKPLYSTSVTLPKYDRGLTSTNIDLARSSLLNSSALGMDLLSGNSAIMPAISNPYLASGPSSQSCILPPLNLGLSQRSLPPPPPAPSSAYDLEGTTTLTGLTAAEHAQLQHLIQQQPSADVPDMLDIPGRGSCHVYVARYSHDPFQMPATDNPENELYVSMGEYLLVWGSQDESLCECETLDGRRGLLPANFIQKLYGEDLIDFHQNVLLHWREAEDVQTSSLPQEFDSGRHSQEYLGEGLYRRADAAPFVDVDADALLEAQDSPVDGPVPPPRQLTLERQLNKSVLISWNHPDSSYPAPIESYHVYVDGVLKTTVKITERPRALVEGVDSNRPHRISVRSVTQNRRSSRDAACTILIGKDVPLGPTYIKAASITTSSVVVSWLPSNSNLQHIVSVNNVQVRTVKPGVYRHTITGLAPNTVYRVSVSVKNPPGGTIDERYLKEGMLSCHMDFRTLSKGKGLPEAPSVVTVEFGPQDGTLLVTWVPVNEDSLFVTGYAVYADGKKVTEVDTPSGDHAVLDIDKIIGLNPKNITVRTKSRDSQSGDSVPTPIPKLTAKGFGYKHEMEKPRNPTVAMHRRSQRTRLDDLGDPSEKDVYSQMRIPAIEITKDSASMSEGMFSEDEYYTDGSSRGMHSQHGGYDLRMQGQRGHDPRSERTRVGPVPPHARDRDALQYYVENPRGMRPTAANSREMQNRSMHQQSAMQPQQPSRVPNDRKVRFFRAMYDYEPHEMSPNPDLCEDELAFTAGDIIKVFGEKDSDGFYWGESKGRKGFVPHNMVAEITDPKLAQSGQPQDRRSRRERFEEQYQNNPRHRMVALFDYDPANLSPNTEYEVRPKIELPFKSGETIYVYGDMDEDGFYYGELPESGYRGLVPSNFLGPPSPSNNYGENPENRENRATRGPGLGVRGPPPPPRNDPLHNRRRDTCPTQPPRTQRALTEFVKDTGKQLATMEAGRGQAADPQFQALPGTADPRRGFRGRGGLNQGPPLPHQDPHQNLNQSHMPNQYSDNQQRNPNNGHEQQQTQQRQVKGGPSVVPDFFIPHKESPTQPAPPPQATFQAPNIMGKLSELTSSGSGAVEAGADLLSKGKELIFMKFGLGGKS